VSTLASVPSAGRGEIRLDLLALEGEEEGRARFQRLITDMVGVIHPTAREVRPNPGDWGIDTFVGELDDGVISIWQSKFFRFGVGKAQMAQIRESFKSAVANAEANHLTLESWTLAVPCLLDPEATKWWDGWRKREKARTQVEIGLWQENHLRGHLLRPDFAHVRANYFGPVPSSALRDVEDVNEPAEYDGALFVKQLHAASILHDGPARTAFFNAEVMTRDVNERESAPELAELRSMRSILEQMWHTRFEAARAEGVGDDGRLPALYPAMCDAVERHHVSSPSALLRDTVVHRTGLVHHLAEAGRVGWVEHYDVIAKAHAEQS
jgi:hypothetical protein